MEPKEATRATVADTIRQHQRDEELHSGAAAKLRGVSCWMATNSHGRVGRIGLGAIKLRQYAKDGAVALTEQLNVAFDFLLELTATIPPRVVDLMRPSPVPLLAYSDAEFTPGRPLRLGSVHLISKLINPL